MEAAKPNRFVYDLTRAEVLEELRSLRDDDGLDHTSELDGREIKDPTTLDDENATRAAEAGPAEGASLELVGRVDEDKRNHI